jgi:uncharacterized Zn finger protein (UPF0148 family)
MTDDTAAQLSRIAAKLKRIEPCAAASIEGRPCVTADVHWCGREIERIAKRVETWSATLAREAERDMRRIVRAEYVAQHGAAAYVAARVHCPECGSGPFLRGSGTLTCERGHEFDTGAEGAAKELADPVENARADEREAILALIRSFPTHDADGDPTDVQDVYDAIRARGAP